MTDPKRFDPEKDAVTPRDEERSPVADRAGGEPPSPLKGPDSEHPPIEEKTREDDDDR